MSTTPIMAKGLETFIDIFAGIGGFHLALAACGLRCVFACERDARCRATYSVNFGLLPAGDVYRVKAEQIPPHDVACFGLPCQPFSRSGSVGGINDPRGVLHREALRIIGHHRPVIVLVENVPQFKTIGDGVAFNELVAGLKQFGYRVWDQVLNASDYGVPQNRERIFIVAILETHLVEEFRFPEPIHSYVELASVLESTDLARRQMTDIRDWVVVQPDDLRWDRVGKGLIKVGHINDNTQGDRIYSVRGHSPTITASTGGLGAGMGLYEVDGVVRRLTTREAARCMGFPESYRFLCGTRTASAQLGNSVVVPVVEAVVREVMKAVGRMPDLECGSITSPEVFVSTPV
jgi:DNA (cytosine-5)-methyltransferase 1